MIFGISFELKVYLSVDYKLYILAGGSWISTGNEATFHGRYAFRRHFFQVLDHLIFVTCTNF